MIVVKPATLREIRRRSVIKATEGEHMLEVCGLSEIVVEVKYLEVSGPRGKRTYSIFIAFTPPESARQPINHLLLDLCHKYGGQPRGCFAAEFPRGGPDDEKDVIDFINQIQGEIHNRTSGLTSPR